MGVTTRTPSATIRHSRVIVNSVGASRVLPTLADTHIATQHALRSRQPIDISGFGVPVRHLLVVGVRQRLLKREPEEARILTDDRSGENQEDVVAGLLGYVLLREQSPEVTIARVLLHRANAFLHARRSPVV